MYPSNLYALASFPYTTVNGQHLRKKLLKVRIIKRQTWGWGKTVERVRQQIRLETECGRDCNKSLGEACRLSWGLLRNVDNSVWRARLEKASYSKCFKKIVFNVSDLRVLMNNCLIFFSPTWSNGISNHFFESLLSA